MAEHSRLVKELVDVAKRGLPAYFDPASGLFTGLQSDSGPGSEKDHLLITHSLISLIGIAKHRGAVAVDFPKAVGAAYEGALRAGGIRELSLLLWLLAENDDARAAEVFGRIDRAPSSFYEDAGTMEVAWLLAGLVFESERRGGAPVGGRMADVLRVLRSRREESGLFLHKRREGSGDFRYRIGNFADQIYSVFALSRHYRASRDKSSLVMADACARRLVELQGDKGQWWWHYDSPAGRVFQGFPVFSVHQDSMAPFALFALQAASRQEYLGYVAKGLRWLRDGNELSADMINAERGFVRRGIERKPLADLAVKLATAAFCLFSKRLPIGALDRSRRLRVMDWEYSYHLGWILYAYSEENKNLWDRL